MEKSRFLHAGFYCITKLIPDAQECNRCIYILNYFTATPDRSHSLDWTKYDKVESRSPNSVHLSHAGKGYALLGPAEEPTTGTPPMLSPHEITKGYSLLGSPTQSRAAANATNARCLVRPDSTYAEVRNEGENFVPTRISLPSQTAFNDYSLLGFPSTGEESEPMPISGR